MESRNRALTVEKVSKGADGRLRVVLTVGRTLTASLKKKVAEGELPAVLAKAVRMGIVSFALGGSALGRSALGASARIVAHVPESLVDDFDKLCRSQGVNRSRVLLPRISRYVDESGRLLKNSYANKTPIAVATRRTKKKPVQILVPPAQAAGFGKFCRKVGIQKDTFVIREMQRMLDMAPKAQEADAETTDGPPDPASPG
jgi:hypothetical protein